mgnify:CR=1 FL=1
MREFMSHHTGNFLVAQIVEEPGGDCDCRIIWITARGEGVWLRSIDDINLGHGQLSTSRQLFNRTDKGGICGFIYLTCAIHRQYHFVRTPIGKDVAEQRKPDGKHQTTFAP